MSEQPKYDPPEGPPPGKQIHQDAGPYYGSSSPAPYNYQGQDVERGYGSPPPQQQQQWGPPQGGYYQSQQGGMYYGQQPYGQQQQGYYGQQPYGQPQGYYGNRGSGAEGICAGLMAALACCCCMDFLF